MGEKYKNLNYLFTILFIASIIYTTLRLFSLQDDLILSSKVLDSSQIVYLTPVLLQLYLSVGAVIISGIIALVLNFRSVNAEVRAANISTGGNNSKADANNLGNEDGNKLSADVGFVSEALKNAKDKNDRLSIVLDSVCKKLELGQGAIYKPGESQGVRKVKFHSGYAFSIAESETIEFEFGEGLVGQAAKEGKMLVVDNIPDNYINIVSGLGSASPKHLMVLPVMKGNTLQAVAELASFHNFSKENIKLIEDSFALINKSVQSDKYQPDVKKDKKEAEPSKTKKTKGASKKTEEGS